MTTELLQMKITLAGIEPEIWRRFVVVSSTTLDDFHEIIQKVMGWDSAHLYGFVIDGMEYMPTDDNSEPDTEDTRGIRLSKFKLKKSAKIKYIYDYGDYWEHIINIENVFTPEEDSAVPACLEGARNCPPEDCGSVPGYEEIVDAMKNPNSNVAKELIEWLGEIYDAEEFDIDKINKQLKPRKKTGRKRAGKIG